MTPQEIDAAFEDWEGECSVEGEFSLYSVRPLYQVKGTDRVFMGQSLGIRGCCIGAVGKWAHRRMLPMIESMGTKVTGFAIVPCSDDYEQPH